MKRGRSLKQSLGMLCGVIAAACAVLYSITLVYVLETAESKLMASVMGDMLQTVVTADILHTYTKIINGKRYVLTRHQGNLRFGRDIFFESA